MRNHLHNNNTDKQIILASASPRRKELLSAIGLEFEVMTADIDENIDDEEFSFELIEALALRKARFIADRIEFPALVIGSDTVVVVGKKILGKPKDQQDAFNMIKELSGNEHRVVSAIAVIDSQTDMTIQDSVSTFVEFRELSDEEILAYINTKEPFDKAGAYAIQGLAGMFVRSIKGCYFNIVGISVFKLAEMLNQFGVKIL